MKTPRNPVGWSIKWLWSIWSIGFFSLISGYTELPPIVTEGTKFVYQNNGSQFFVKGIHYGDWSPWNQSATIDPVDDDGRCKIDIPLLQKLGINVVFLANVRPVVDHSSCLAYFQEAGLYVMIEWRGSNRFSVNGTQYRLFDMSFQQDWITLIDNLSGFSNIIGTFASAVDPLMLPQYKGLTRDVKKHVKKMKRPWLVGVNTLNHRKTNTTLNYLTCGDEKEAVDFILIAPELYTDYRLRGYACQNSTSLYSETMDLYRHINVPLLFNYFRCSDSKQEDFDEIDYLYRPPLADVFSGGLLNLWVPGQVQPFEMGLVETNGSTGRKVLPQFSNLASRLASISPSIVSTPAAEIVQTRSYASCTNVVIRKDVDSISFRWVTRDLNISAVVPPPTNKRSCSCLIPSLECVARPYLSFEDHRQQRNQICAMNETLCRGWKEDPETGWYPAYARCDVTERTSFSLNQYYLANNSTDEACTDVGGVRATPLPSASMASDCKSILKQVGPYGLGNASLLRMVEPTDGPRGLSAVAKAGIGISVSMATVSAALGCLLLRNRRKRKASIAESKTSEEVSELPPGYSPTDAKPVELMQSNERMEMDGETAPVEISPINYFELVELPNDNEVKELSANGNEKLMMPSGEQRRDETPTTTNVSSGPDSVQAMNQENSIRNQVEEHTQVSSEVSPKPPPEANPIEVKMSESKSSNGTREVNAGPSTS